MSQFSIHGNGQTNAIGFDPAVENDAIPNHTAPVREGHIPPELGELRGPAQVRREAQASAPVADRNLAGAAEPGREGFLSRVGRAFRDFFQRLRGGFQLPPSVQLSMPGGGSIEFPSDRLISMIKALPRSQRAEAAAHIQETLQGRLDAGHALLDAVYSDRAEVGPTTRNVADVMLFLEAKAIQTGNAFTEGAFNIEDGEGRLAKWLDTCSERYQRSSSHLENQIRIEVDGHLNTHRGIDIPEGIDGLTSDKATLLFGTIPANEALGTDRRIFLKMESHGCRLSTLRDADRTHGLAQGANPDRPVRSSDFKSMLGHGISFIATRGKGSAEGSRKERIPDTVKAAFRELLKSVPEQSALGAALRENDPLNSGSGIRVMLRNINVAAAAEGMREDFDGVRQQVGEFFHALNSMQDKSHLDVRIGNEVIFNRNEL